LLKVVLNTKNQSINQPTVQYQNKSTLFITFSNISAISWRPVLVVEEAGVPGDDHRIGQATFKHYHLRVHPFL
jgi:hypothetical protein